MDCSNNQPYSSIRRPQRPMPPCMNTSCPCSNLTSQPYSQDPLPSIRRNQPGMSGSGYPFDHMSLAMAYVPIQSWKQTYSLEQSISRGTIFPELDLPFIMGRCQ